MAWRCVPSGSERSAISFGEEILSRNDIIG